MVKNTHASMIATVNYEPVSRKIKNGPNRTEITFRGEAEDGKLRFGSFFVYGRGSYKIFLRLWQENTALPDAQRPGNTYFRAADQKKSFFTFHLQLLRQQKNFRLPQAEFC